MDKVGRAKNSGHGDASFAAATNLSIAIPKRVIFMDGNTSGKMSLKFSDSCLYITKK